MKTGGPLNILNEMSQSNSVSNTVSIMKLINYHKPTNPLSIKKLIEEHSYYDCKCECVSNGPLEKFALHLFESQFNCKQWECKYIISYSECYSFMFNLFCLAPLKGLKMENESKLFFKNKGFKITESTEYQDIKLGIDFFITKDEKTVGIQVKPNSFFKRKNELQIQKKKHSLSKIPVFFDVYNGNSFKEPYLVFKYFKLNLDF